MHICTRSCPVPSTGTSSPCNPNGIVRCFQPLLALQGWDCMHGCPSKQSQKLGSLLGSGKMHFSQPWSLWYIEAKISCGRSRAAEGVSSAQPFIGICTWRGSGRVDSLDIILVKLGPRFLACSKEAIFWSWVILSPLAAFSKSFWAALAMVWTKAHLISPFAKWIISSSYNALWHCCSLADFANLWCKPPLLLAGGAVDDIVWNRAEVKQS